MWYTQQDPERPEHFVRARGAVHAGIVSIHYVQLDFTASKHSDDFPLLNIDH